MKDKAKILVAYDGSEYAAAALDDLRAAQWPAQAQVVVLSVIEHWLPPPSSLELIQGVSHYQETLAQVRRAAASLKILRPKWDITPEVIGGSPASEIVAKADVWHPDLIMIGSHGRSALGRFFLGSVSQSVLHHARCSVRVARGHIHELGTPLRLLAGSDGSKYSEAAVQAIAERPWPTGTEIRLVNASLSIPAAVADHLVGQMAEWVTAENTRIKKVLQESVRKLESAGLRVTSVVREEDPRHLLLSEAEQWGADCIFVGARGAGVVDRLLVGSVSSAVAARAHCSVEIVRLPATEK
jgi:nucleotide-binding universal stress UspA family protein